MCEAEITASGKRDASTSMPWRRTECAVALALKRRARIDEREIDVEEHRLRRRRHPFPSAVAAARASYGPAMTTDARFTSSVCLAAAFTSSSVTASSKRRQPQVVVEPQPKELRGLEKRRNRAVGLEQPGDRADQVLLAVVELLRASVLRSPSAEFPRRSKRWRDPHWPGSRRRAR